LLDEGLALANAEGMGAVSLREVARRAGVSHAAPYRHFADKDALLAALGEEGFLALTASMRERMARAGSAAERLAGCGMGYVLFAIRQPAHFGLMFATRTFDVSAHPGVLAAADAAFAVLLEAIAGCQEAGSIPRGDPRPFALTAWAMVHGLGQLMGSGACELLGIAPGDREQAAEDAIRRGLFGMLARPRRAGRR
jgi:AcrR family transcriptional regulator